MMKEGSYEKWLIVKRRKKSGNGCRIFLNRTVCKREEGKVVIIRRERMIFAIRINRNRIQGATFLHPSYLSLSLALSPQQFFFLQ